MLKVRLAFLRRGRRYIRLLSVHTLRIVAWSWPGFLLCVSLVDVVIIGMWFLDVNTVCRVVVYYQHNDVNRV